MVRFLLLIFLIFNITLSSKAKEPIDSLSLKCCSVKIYRSIDSMYLEKSNLDGVFNSHLAFELAVEIEKNKSFFKFYSLDIINSLFDNVVEVTFVITGPWSEPIIEKLDGVKVL